MTALEWLSKQLEDYGEPYKLELKWEDLDSLVEQAKEMEKQQIIDAYANAVMKENNSDYVGMHEQSSGEIYFAETYGSKGSVDHIVDANEMVSSQTEISEQIVFDFAEWMVSGVSYVDDTERGRVYNYKNKVYTTKELFEEFLKTKQ